MPNTITYPLKVALSLSSSAGAMYTGGEGFLTLQTIEGWLVTGELYQETVCEEFEDYEECSCYLARRKIPEQSGWIPEPLALIPNEGWI